MSTAPTGLALYVVTDRDWRLMRLDYRDGIEVGRAEIPLQDNCDLSAVGTTTIHEGRICYTVNAAVIDLATGETKSGPTGQVLGLDGNRLICRFSDGIEHYPGAIDLDTFEKTELPRPNHWQLPGRRSPDGLRTVATRGDTYDAAPDELWLYEFGRPPLLLAYNLRASLSQVSSATPDQLPKLWVDETHVLTQRDNGELIIFRDDGAVVATISLPLDDRDRRPIMPPRSRRDLDGRIVYSCGGHFRINPADREWGGYPWRPLGCGFAIETAPGPDGALVTHREESLGRVHMSGPIPATCPGHLAIRLGDGLHVWSEGVGWQWSGLKVLDIIGWVDRREEMT
jgi:hypothetical protein